MKRDLKVNFKELNNISIAARGFQYSINDVSAALENIKKITYQDSGCLNDAVSERIENFRKNTKDISDFLVSVHNIIDEYCETQQKYLTPECIAVPVESDRDSLYFKLLNIKNHISGLKIITLQNDLFGCLSDSSEESISTADEDAETNAQITNKQSNYFKIQEICDSVIPDHISRINSEMRGIDSIYENNVKKFENTDDDFRSRLKSVYKYFKNINFYRTTAYIKLMIASAMETVSSYIRNLKMNLLITFTESTLTVNSALRKNDQKYLTSENELKTYYGYTYGPNSDFSDMKCIGGMLECFPKNKNTKVLNNIPLSEYELKHPVVFNTDIENQYGGNQGAPQKIVKNSDEYNMMFDIASKNDSSVTKENFDSYLKQMNTEGCGHVSLVNSIMCRYESSPEEFEKTFGYPMYKSDHTLNYECLFTDLYSAEDTSGSGTTPVLRNKYIKSFMADHGIEAGTKELSYLCPENFKEITDSGKTVLVSFHCGKLECENGTVRQNISSHSMVVTGFTDDGRIIVSSWGQRLYIDPEDPERVTHKSSVTGKDVLFHSGPSISFETLEIN